MNAETQPCKRLTLTGAYRYVFLASVGLCCSVAVGVFVLTGYVQEDAMIVARYIDNASVGHELAYNPGHPVYGFSSPLFFVLSLMVAFFLPTGESVLAMRLVGTGVFMAASWFTFRLLLVTLQERSSGSDRRRKRWLWMPALLVALDFPLLINAVNGMEGPLVALLLTTALYCQLRSGDSPLNGVLWGVALLARPDTVFAIGVLFFFAAFEDRRRALTHALVAILVYMPWGVFCLWHFGTAIPQTIIAKAAAYSHGGPWFTARVASFTQSLIGLFGHDYNAYGLRPMSTVVYVGMVLIGISGFLYSPIVRRLSALLMIYLLYFGFSGANQFPWYFAGPRAVMLVLAALGVWRILDVPCRTDLMRGLFSGVGVTALVLVLCVGTINGRNIQCYYEEGVRKEAGLFIARRASAGDSLLTESLGYIGYYAGIHTYDYPGLVTPAFCSTGSPAADYANMVDRFRPTFMALRPMERMGMERAIPTVTADYHCVATIGLPSAAPAYMHRSNWTPYEVWERKNASCRRP